MPTQKTIGNICIILATFFHFVFFFGLYGPNGMIYRWSYIIPWIITLLLFGMLSITNWKSNVEGKAILFIYGLYVILALIGVVRAALKTRGWISLAELFMDSYNGLALLPIFFFIIGSNIKFFIIINKTLVFYCVIAFLFSLLFLEHTSLMTFLLMPIFYVIITFPLQTRKARILFLIISVVAIILSLTHRAGVVRIIISYLIVLSYYLLLGLKLNRRLVYFMVFCILLLPYIFIYYGSKGNSVFRNLLGETDDFSQENLMADTRTLLYIEVFQELKTNKSYVFGGGVTAGYRSYRSLERRDIEVGFLQMMLKLGIVGFIVYMSLILSAIYKALNRAKSKFFTGLGLLLASYVILFFLGNVFAYDLLNIIIWLVIGMCHSRALLSKEDYELKRMYQKKLVTWN